MDHLMANSAYDKLQKLGFEWDGKEWRSSNAAVDRTAQLEEALSAMFEHAEPAWCSNDVSYRKALEMAAEALGIAD